MKQNTYEIPTCVLKETENQPKYTYELLQRGELAKRTASQGGWCFALQFWHSLCFPFSSINQHEPIRRQSNISPSKKLLLAYLNTELNVLTAILIRLSHGDAWISCTKPFWLLVPIQVCVIFKEKQMSVFWQTMQQQRWGDMLKILLSP